MPPSRPAPALPGPAPGPTVDLTVVVLSWNTRAHTLAALAAVEAAAAPYRVQTVCVDNASGDGTADAVRAAHPGTLVLENETNLGFARGNAVAVPHARGRVLCFLNSDTVASPGSLARAVRHLDEHPGVGIVAPRLVATDGSAQRAAWGLPTVRSLLHQHTTLGWLRFGRGEADRVRRRGLDETTGPVEAVSGACLLVRADVFRRLGGFDPGYPFYFEDVDLCRRAREAGVDVHVVVDGPPVVHLGGVSTTLAGGATRLPLLQGALRYLSKATPPRRFAALSWLFKSGVVVRAAVEVLRAPFVWLLRRLRGRPDRARRALRAASERLRFFERDLGPFLRYVPVASRDGSAE